MVYRPGMELRDVGTQQEAEGWLSALGERLLAGAITDGHDAAALEVPEWARPITPQARQVIDEPGKPVVGLLFDLPDRPRRKSRPRPKTRRQRKSMADAWSK